MWEIEFLVIYVPYLSNLSVNLLFLGNTALEAFGPLWRDSGLEYPGSDFLHIMIVRVVIVNMIAFMMIDVRPHSGEL